MAGQITYKVGFRLEGKDLAEQIKTPLQAIHADIAMVGKKAKRGMSEALGEGVHQAQILESVLKRATTDKGLSFISMNNALRQANSSVGQMVAGLSGAGMQNALNTFLLQISQADSGIIRLNGRIKEMQRILAQSVQYSIAQDIQRFVIGQVQRAVGYVQDLNRAIIEIGIVAPEVQHRLDGIADSIIRNSRELRVTAREYAEASVIFWQQGLSEEEVNRRTQITVMAAKASGQTMVAMSEQLTAVWNTYRMAGDEMGRAAAVAAALGANTAAEFQDIAVGMQIAASGASMLGVEYESLAAIMATVRETTLQSASVIGNAFKTIFARLSNLRAGGFEDGTDLGQITNQLNELGVSVLDQSGNLRDLDAIIMQLGLTWNEYSRNQQIAISQVIGGVRQYQHFLALMQNFDKYQQNLAMAFAIEDDSELIRQYEQFLDGIESAIQNKGEAWQQAFAQLFRSDDQLTFFRTLESIGNVMGDLIASLGGARGLLLIIGALLAGKIGTGIDNLVGGLKTLWDSRTPEAAFNAISRQLDADNNTAIADMQAGGASKQEVGALTQKLELTKKITLENMQLKKEMQGASAVRKVQIEQQLKINDAIMAGGAAALDTLPTHQKELNMLRAKLTDIENNSRARKESDGDMIQAYEDLKAKAGNLTEAEEARLEVLVKQINATQELEKLKEAISKTEEKQDNREKEIERINELLKEQQAIEEKLTTKRGDGLAEMERKIREKETELEERRAQEAEEIAALRKEVGYEKLLRLEQKNQLTAEQAELLQKTRERFVEIRDVGNKISDEVFDMNTALRQTQQNAGSLSKKEQRRLAEAQRLTQQYGEQLGRIRNNHSAAEGALRTMREQVRVQGQIINGETERSTAARALQTVLEGTQMAMDEALGLEVATEKIDEIKGQIRDLGAEFANMDGAEVQELGNEMQALADSNRDLHEILPEIHERLAALTEEGGAELATINAKITASLKDMTAAVEANNEAKRKAGEQQPKTISGFTEWAGAIGKVSGAVTLLSRGMSTLINDIQSGNVSIGSMISTMLQMSMGVGVLITQYEALTATMMKHIAGKKIETKVLAMNSAAKKVAAFASIKKAVADLKAAKTAGILTKKLIATKIAAILAGAALLPFKLIVIGLLKPVILIIAAITALVAIFMIWQKRQAAANERAREAAQLHREQAVRARELRGELGDLATSVRNLSDELAAGNLTGEEYNRMLAELLERAEAINNANPTLNLTFTGDLDDFYDQIRSYEQTAGVAAEREALERAMRLEAGAITRGTNRGGTGTRNLDRGVGGAATTDVVAAINSLGLGEAMNLGVDGTNVVDTVALAKHFDDILKEMDRLADGNAAAIKRIAEFRGEMLNDTSGFGELLDIAREYNSLMDEITTAEDRQENRNMLEGMNADERVAKMERLRNEAERYRETSREIANIEARRAEIANLKEHGMVSGDDLKALEREDDLLRNNLTIAQTRNKEVANGAQQYRELTTAVRTGTDATSQMLQAELNAIEILNSALDKRLFGEEEWRVIQENALENARNGYFHLIGSLDEYTDGLVILSSRYDALNDAIGNFDYNASSQEQIAALSEINEAIDALIERGADVERLPEYFFSLSTSQQQARLAAIAHASAIEQAGAAQDIAAGRAANAERAYERLTEARLREEEALQRVQEAQEAHNRMSIYDPAYIASRNRLRDITAEHAETVQVLASAYQHAEHMQNQATNAAERALIYERKLNDAIRERNSAIRGAIESMDVLSGSFLEQQHAFNQMNDDISEFNNNLRELYGEHAPQIGVLPAYFMALNEAQQQSLISTRQLAMAQSELTAANQKLIATQNDSASSADDVFQATMRVQVATTNLGRALAQNANLDFTQMDRYADHLRRVARNSSVVSEEMATNRRTSLEVAAAMMQLNRGLTTIDSSFDDWADTLRNASRYSEEMGNAIWEITDAISDLLGVSQDMMAESFFDRFLGEPEQVEEMLALLDKVRWGCEESFEILSKMAAEDFINDIFGEGRDTLFDTWNYLSDINEEMQYFGEYSDIMAERFAELDSMMQEVGGWGELWNYFGDQLRDAMYIGATVDQFGHDTDEVIARMLDMVNKAGMTVEEANAAFAKLGFTADLETTTVDAPQRFPTTITRTWPTETIRDDDGNIEFREVRQQTFPAGYEYANAPKTILTMGTFTKDGQGTGAPTPSIRATSEGGGGLTRRGGPGGAGGGAMRMANRTPSQRAADQGGGGGGSSGSVGTLREATEVKPEEFHVRFTDIRNEIDDIARAINRVAAAQDLAWGMNRLALMREQQALLQQSAEAYGRLHAAARDYVRLDRAGLESNGIIGGIIQFADNGTIRNIEAVQRELERYSQIAADAHNAAVEANNARAAQLAGMEEFYKETQEQLDEIIGSYDELIERYEAKMEAAKEAWDLANERKQYAIDLMDRYNAALQQERDALDAIKNQIRDYLRMEVSRIQMQVELRVSLNNDDINRIQNTINRLGPRAGAHAQAQISRQMDFIGKNLEEMYMGMSRMMQKLSDVSNPDLEDTSFWAQQLEVTSEAWEAMVKNGEAAGFAMDALLDKARALEAEIQRLFDAMDRMVATYLAALQSYTQEMNTLIGSLDASTRWVNAWFEIWHHSGQQYRDRNFAIQILNTQLHTEQARIKSLRNQYDFLNNSLTYTRQVYEDMRKANEAFRDTDREGAFDAQVYQLRNEIVRIENDILESTVSIREGLVAITQVLAQQAAIAAENIVYEFTTGLNGIFTTMDEAMAMFQRQTNIDTFFLSDRTREFEMREMMRRIENEMGDWLESGDADLLAEHAKWVQRINDLKAEGVQMTQAELDILNAEFDLAIAKAAWQEAQEARQKTTMRLARDASGNWSYVFSDDETDPLDAADQEAEIDRITHNIYQMHRDAAASHEAMWLQIQADQRRFISEINWDMYHNDMEYQAMVRRTLQQYQELSAKHARQIALHNGAIDRSFADTSLGIVTNVDSIERAEKKWQANHTAMKLALSANNRELHRRTAYYFGKMGFDYNNLQRTVEREMGKVEDHNNSVVTNTRNLNRDATNSLRTMANNIRTEVQRMINEFARLIAKIDALIAKLKELARHQAGSNASQDARGLRAAGSALESLNIQHKRGEDTSAAFRYHGDHETVQSALEGVSEFNRGVFERFSATDGYGFDGGMNDFVWWSERDHKRRRFDMERFLFDKAIVGDDIWNRLPDYHLDTGGLVRRLTPAVLAADGNAELVLNASDTKNMLEAVRIMRESINRHLGGLGHARSTVINQVHSNAPQQLDQNVHIQADFPNVTSSGEIEAAFNNLVNEAAQYRIKPRV